MIHPVTPSKKNPNPQPQPQPASRQISRYFRSEPRSPPIRRSTLACARPHLRSPPSPAPLRAPPPPASASPRGRWTCAGSAAPPPWLRSPPSAPRPRHAATPWSAGRRQPRRRPCGLVVLWTSRLRVFDLRPPVVVLWTSRFRVSDLGPPALRGSALAQSPSWTRRPHRRSPQPSREEPSTGSSRGLASRSLKRRSRRAERLSHRVAESRAAAEQPRREKPSGTATSSRHDDIQLLKNLKRSKFSRFTIQKSTLFRGFGRSLFVLSPILFGSANPNTSSSLWSTCRGLTRTSRSHVSRRHHAGPPRRCHRSHPLLPLCRRRLCRPLRRPPRSRLNPLLGFDRPIPLPPRHLVCHLLRQPSASPPAPPRSRLRAAEPQASREER